MNPCFCGKHGYSKGDVFYHRGIEDTEKTGNPGECAVIIKAMFFHHRGSEVTEESGRLGKGRLR
jgi:hypothetical protein